MWKILIVAGVLTLPMCWWLLDRQLRYRLRRRPPVDWIVISSTDFPEQSDRLAISIVLPAIAQWLRISEKQVYPDDDIVVDYGYPALWRQLMLDHPADGIIDTIAEKIDELCSPWKPPANCVRVRDIIANVSRHLKEQENRQQAIE